MCDLPYAQLFISLSLLQPTDRVAVCVTGAYMSLATCATYQSEGPVRQNRPAPVNDAIRPEMSATPAWLTQPCSNLAFNGNTFHFRQLHWPVAGPAECSILQPCPEHQIFSITPVAAPEVIVFIKPDFHWHVPPLIFSQYIRPVLQSGGGQIKSLLIYRG